MSSSVSILLNKLLEVARRMLEVAKEERGERREERERERGERRGRGREERERGERRERERREERGERGAYQSKMEVQWHHPESIQSLLERVVPVYNVSSVNNRVRDDQRGVALVSSYFSLSPSLLSSYPILSSLPPPFTYLFLL